MTRVVKIGDKVIGGGNPVLIQSMLCVHHSDILGNIKQAKELEEAGCEIIRVSIPTPESVKLITELKKSVSCPIVADIHFDHRLALAAVEAGVDKIRINPGNIGSLEKAREVAFACKHAGIPIRVGVNSGSCEKEFLDKYHGPTAEALYFSAMKHVHILEDCEFYNTVISMKSTNVKNMIQSYRLAHENCDYPLHLGITEAGTEKTGSLKSAIGIGSLLIDSIGDTIRVSLNADVVKEVEAAKKILTLTDVRVFGPTVIACPTCGRTEIDLMSIAEQVENAVQNMSLPIKIAVMGCVVNGPGEAREADIGIAGGKGEAVLFKKGKVIRKIKGNIAEELIKEINNMQV